MSDPAFSVTVTMSRVWEIVTRMTLSIRQRGHGARRRLSSNAHVRHVLWLHA